GFNDCFHDRIQGLFHESDHERSLIKGSMTAFMIGFRACSMNPIMKAVIEPLIKLLSDAFL
ncbi:hypothetical protein PSZ44_23820, partial [Shigella flexneri]|nr:hypothetical protein [Shigella flexneri]